MEEIKRCPFCGDIPETGDWFDSWTVSDADFGCGSGTSTMTSSYIYIRHCGVEMKEYFDNRKVGGKEVATASIYKRWNTRATI